MNNAFKIKTGLQVEPKTGSTVTTQGDLAYNSSSNQVEIYTTAAESVTTTVNTQTLTNKVLSGNTATNLVSGSGTLTLNTSGTITVPNATDTLTANATSSTLTNKSIDANNNTLTNIANAAISSSAAIAYSKLALTGAILNADLAGSIAASKLVGSDIATVGTVTSGTWSATTIALNKGGTGQTTKAAAFDALSPMTTSGDIIYGGTSGTGTRLAAGGANQVLKYVNGAPSWATLSAGGINYINGNPDAEVDTTGWTTYADAAQNIPVDATGGSPVSTWTRSTSSPLRGTGSFLWTKASSANRQGEGVAYAFTIDSADQARPLQISFDYAVASGTFTASDGITAPKTDATTSTGAGNSDIEVFIYDVTNSTLIVPTPITLTASSSNTFSYKGTFQTPSNSTSYRLVLHTATNTTNNFTIKFDNFSVGPQVVPVGAPVTDWVTYTPTGSWVSNTTYTGYWRRVGDTMEVDVGVVVSGAPTSTTLSVNLPSGYTIDTTKINSSVAGEGAVFGHAFSRDSGVTTYMGAVGYLSTTAVAPERFNVSGSQVALNSINQAAPFTFGASDGVYLNFKVPIVGWSSAVSMSNDTDTRVVSLAVHKSTTQSINDSTETTITSWDTVDFDTHGAFNTSSGTYTIPVSGYYNIRTFVDFTQNSTGYRYSALYKNGALVQYGNAATALTADSTRILNEAIIKCIAGDTIIIKGWQNSGGALNIRALGTSTAMYVERLTGPSVIAATETVSGRYFASSTTISGSLATINYTTKDFDSHGAYSAGTITIPSSGTYQFNCGLLITGTVSLNNNAAMQLQVNGTAKSGQTEFFAASLTDGTLQLSDILHVNAGDTVRIQVSTNVTVPSIVSSNTDNFFSWARIGN